MAACGKSAARSKSRSTAKADIEELSDLNVEILERRDHDHQHVAHGRISLDLLQDGHPVHYRHEDVEQDDVRLLDLQPIERLPAVRSRTTRWPSVSSERTSSTRLTRSSSTTRIEADSGAAVTARLRRAERSTLGSPARAAHRRGRSDERWRRGRPPAPRSRGAGRATRAQSRRTCCRWTSACALRGRRARHRRRRRAAKLSEARRRFVDERVDKLRERLAVPAEEVVQRAHRADVDRPDRLVWAQRREPIRPISLRRLASPRAAVRSPRRFACEPSASRDRSRGGDGRS
jgi:hypothetical protein